jgi:hypothetical protein
MRADVPFVDHVDSVDRAITATLELLPLTVYADLSLAWINLLDALETEGLI